MSGAESQRIDQATLDRARTVVPLSSLVGKRVKLSRSGRDWAGLCPFHQEKSPSFNVVDSKHFYHCFGCGAHGSAIDWLIEVEGLGFREAVQSLVGGQLPDARRTAHFEQRERAERRVDVVSSHTAGAWIWRTSGPARGEIVEKYLRSRDLDPYFDFAVGAPGLACGGAPTALDRLRFHPRCPLGAWRVDEDPAAAWRTAPAMVVPIEDGDGLVWGVRVTWLKPDGSGEAALPKLRDGRDRPKRKMFGKLGGNAAWLSGHAGETAVRGTDGPGGEGIPLVVGEGFETSWAFAQQFGRPCRVMATLSLENLQGGAVKLRDGSLPLWNVRADPERAPVTVPDPGAVIILVDADMKPLRQQKVQRARGEKPVRADISGLERAELCAQLAAQAWRRAGASSVTCLRPRMGSDFNDALKASLESDPASGVSGGQPTKTVDSDFNDAIRSEAA